MSQEPIVGEQPPRRSPRLPGLVMVVAGASLWGLSGTAAQTLFQADGFKPGWLVAARMTAAGLVLLLLTAARGGRRGLLGPWSRLNWPRLLLFALVGLVGVQYSYFAAIQKGNAATATLLQYVGPSLIVAYLAVRRRRWPHRPALLALFFSLAGTGLLVTNGSLSRLAVSPAAAEWGLVSAVALVFYTLYPVPLVKRWGSAAILGWAMLIGGVATSFFAPPWAAGPVTWSLSAVLLVGFVIVFGTVAAFYLYLASMRHLSPEDASLAATAEPLAASLAAILWLHVHMGGWQIAGGLFIIVTVLMLARWPLAPG